MTHGIEYATMEGFDNMGMDVIKNLASVHSAATFKGGRHARVTEVESIYLNAGVIDIIR